MHIRIDLPETVTNEAAQDLAQTLLSVAVAQVPGSLVSIQDVIFRDRETGTMLGADLAADGMAEEYHWETRDRS